MLVTILFPVLITHEIIMGNDSRNTNLAYRVTKGRLESFPDYNIELVLHVSTRVM